MRRPLAAMFAGLVLVALAVPAKGGDILARYALFAHDPLNDRTVLLVRAVIDGAGEACPGLDVDGQSVPMSPRDNPDQATFPVTVCEALAMPASTVALDGAAIPTMAGHDGGDLHVVVVGDTGCKGEPEQDCATAWPFAEIARDAAAGEPDLVLHVGDYNYIGSPYKGPDGEPVYDGCFPAGWGPLHRVSEFSDWSSWYADVVVPALPLLEAAPWVATRGNHELCSRAGQGWFYLLDPHSVLLEPYAEAPRCDAPLVATEPYPLRIAGLTLIVVDDTNTCDAQERQDQAAWAYQTQQLSAVIDRVGRFARQADGPVWLVTHRPLWAASRYFENGPLAEGSYAWQRTMSASRSGGLPDNVMLVLSGHVHDGQALTFDGPRPPQLIVGNSGTSLNENYVARPVEVEIDGLAATGWVAAVPGAKHSFGYLDAKVRDAGTWQARMPAYMADGTAAGTDIMTCGMPVRDGMVCSPP